MLYETLKNFALNSVHFFRQKGPLSCIFSPTYSRKHDFVNIHFYNELLRILPPDLFLTWLFYFF
jgi:hypothetical protein